jgi:RimJ/RimL family protein N-acetyltransferase
MVSRRHRIRCLSLTWRSDSPKTPLVDPKNTRHSDNNPLKTSMKKMATVSVFPFAVPEASNERVKLVAFDPNRHCEAFFRLSSPHPETYAHMPMVAPSSAEEFKSWFYSDSTSHILSFSNPQSLSFAVIDKTRPPSTEDTEGELAGTVSFIRTSPTNLCTEIGFIVILPPYQRSHVASNTVGLVLQIAFNSPSDDGIGLRRVHWSASTTNLASVRLATRMGFEKVGMTPWHMRFVKGRLNGKIGNGKDLPPGGDAEDLWRDTFSFSLAWDRWENAARAMTEKAMAR